MIFIFRFRSLICLRVSYDINIISFSLIYICVCVFTSTHGGQRTTLGARSWVLATFVFETVSLEDLELTK